MRIIGDNSDGFRNEIDIEKALDFKLYEDVNPNLRHFLDDIFRGYNIRGKRIHAIRCRQNVKPDFYLHIDGIDKEVYVSIKKGSGNSIHQESLDSFIKFMRSIRTPETIIDDLLYYHYADDTKNNTGTIRYKAQEYAKKHPEIVDRLNNYFSKESVLNRMIERFVFRGAIEDAPVAQYLYHGTVHNGVWASKEEIFKYISNYTVDSTAVCIGPTTYQVWNRNLEFVNSNEKKRKQIQIKWGKLEKMLIEITSRREEYRQVGTYEGDMSEKASVIMFNRDPDNQIFREYIKNINKAPETVLMIRVTTKQMSSLSNQKVNTRADAYAIEVLDQRMYDVLEENDYYLDEDIISNYDGYYSSVNNSGISIKKDNSENYTLIKLTPNSFYELFESYELGYGASIFCKNSTELHYNIPLLDGWKTTIEDLQEYFDSDSIDVETLTQSLEMCKKIKDISVDRIKTSIDNSPRLQAIIFNGKDIYDEPYVAHYFMQNNQIRLLGYIPYNVTTGSGRSHGDYSIVLKPKQNRA